MGGRGGLPQPRGTRPTPGVPPASPSQAAREAGLATRRGPARGGPRLYLLLRSRPRVARLAFPAPSAAAATTRLKGPGARSQPGAGSAGRQRRWAARAPGDTRFRSLLPRAGAPGAPQGAGRRCAGRAPEEDAGEEGFRPPSGGSPSIRAAKSVSRTPRAAWARSASGARCGAAGRCAESARSALAAGERAHQAGAGDVLVLETCLCWFHFSTCELVLAPSPARALYACVCVVLFFCFF